MNFRNVFNPDDFDFLKEGIHNDSREKLLDEK